MARGHTNPMRLSNMNRSIGFAFVLISFCNQIFGQSSAATPSDSSAQKRHEAYREANRQVYARHEDPGSGNLNASEQNVRSIAKQLDSMIGKEIEMALSTPEPSPQRVISAIAALQGDISRSTWGPEETNTPFVKLFSLNGIQTAAVAYVIMQGGDATPDTQPYLVFYDNASGDWSKKAAAPTLDDFEGCTFSVAQLNSSASGEGWFLAWGIPFGSSHGSVRVRLYSFDGFTVHTPWKRDNLDGGKITVVSDTVIIDYLDSRDPSIQKHEVFHLSANGLLPQ